MYLIENKMSSLSGRPQKIVVNILEEIVNQGLLHTPDVYVVQEHWSIGGPGAQAPAVIGTEAKQWLGSIVPPAYSLCITWGSSVSFWVPSYFFNRK